MFPSLGVHFPVLMFNVYILGAVGARSTGRLRCPHSKPGQIKPEPIWKPWTDTAGDDTRPACRVV